MIIQLAMHKGRRHGDAVLTTFDSSAQLLAAQDRLVRDSRSER